MTSRSRSEALDLDRDLPTTAADVAALRRARLRPPVDLDEYLRFLSQVAELGVEIRQKPLPKGFAPFTLPT